MSKKKMRKALSAFRKKDFARERTQNMIVEGAMRGDHKLINRAVDKRKKRGIKKFNPELQQFVKAVTKVHEGNLKKARKKVTKK